MRHSWNHQWVSCPLARFRVQWGIYHFQQKDLLDKSFAATNHMNLFVSDDSLIKPCFFLFAAGNQWDWLTSSVELVWNEWPKKFHFINFQWNTRSLLIPGDKLLPHWLLDKGAEAPPTFLFVSVMNLTYNSNRSYWSICLPLWSDKLHRMGNDQSEPQPDSWVPPPVSSSASDWSPDLDVDVTGQSYYSQQDVIHQKENGNLFPPRSKVLTLIWNFGLMGWFHSRAWFPACTRFITCVSVELSSLRRCTNS